MILAHHIDFVKVLINQELWEGTITEFFMTFKPEDIDQLIAEYVDRLEEELDEEDDFLILNALTPVNKMPL